LTLLKRVALGLLILTWLVSAGLNASRPIVRLTNPDTYPPDLSSLIIQNETFHPRTYQPFGGAVREASQQINSNTLELIITTGVSSRQYRQLQFLSRLWVHPKILVNNPLQGDIRLPQLPPLSDTCQTIQPEIVLCPSSE